MNILKKNIRRLITINYRVVRKIERIQWK